MALVVIALTFLDGALVAALCVPDCASPAHKYFLLEALWMASPFALFGFAAFLYRCPNCKLPPVRGMFESEDSSGAGANAKTWPSPERCDKCGVRLKRRDA